MFFFFEFLFCNSIFTQKNIREKKNHPIEPVFFYYINPYPHILPRLFFNHIYTFSMQYIQASNASPF